MRLQNAGKKEGGGLLGAVGGGAKLPRTAGGNRAPRRAFMARRNYPLGV